MVVGHARFRYPKVANLEGTSLWFGYCPHSVTVYIRAPSMGYIQPYYHYYPTVTGWGQYPTYDLCERAGKLSFIDKLWRGGSPNSGSVV